MAGSEPNTDSKWYALGVDEMVDSFDSNLELGLTNEMAAERLIEYGPNELQSEPPPSRLKVALGQVVDPMNLMLIAVAVVSLAIGEISTGFLIAVLVLVNVVMGAQQELKAKAAVDALAKLQVPMTRVIRSGNTQEVDASEIVPGDLVQIEAGDLVPADARIARSATLEVQEAALTGESAPIAKDSTALAGDDVVLADRTSMVYQNTSVTRGTATVVVTDTGMSTQMGRIATMLTSVDRKRSPLQRELDSLTKVLGVIAWGAVAIIVGIGALRGLETSELLLLGTAMAISAIPTGMPTFVQGILSYGSKQLAEAKAVVKNLTDVETLGSTSAINTDKTGTLTMNQMMASRLYHDGSWFTIEGSGYRTSGEIRGVAGESAHDFTRMAYALVLDSDAVIADDGTLIGDPTEGALVVLAAKLGVDAQETRRAYPRLAEVPFDSSYKFMSTLHRVPFEGQDRLIIDAANVEMGSQGLRVLSLAARLIDPADEDAALADPMSFVMDLQFVSLIGIIDPLRPSAKEAVRLAKAAGIDVRMITGDNAVTAMAIGQELDLGPGAISGGEFKAMSDDEVIESLDELHVFGRVTPEDKLRLVQLMQAQGMIVAMTGDAVNDAAALKQADIGVAMGSGSEVTKQAAKMILTDDNFGTLVHAVELGRSIYQKIVLYVRYQMSQLLSLVFLFLTASVFNIASGVALTPMMVLFLNFLVASAPVIVILLEPVNPGLMNIPPRDPSRRLTNKHEIIRWLIYGSTLFFVTLVPLIWGPDEPSAEHATASMTMAFAVMAFGTLLTGLAVRRDPGPAFPVSLRTVGILLIPVALTVIATQWAVLQRLLGTQPLTGEQWIGSLTLASVVFVVIEVEKLFRRHRATREVEPADPVVILHGSSVSVGDTPATV